MTEEQTRIWTRGWESYRKALEEEEKDDLSPLQKALRSETDPAMIETLNKQIEAVRVKFKKRRKSADSSLFGRA